MINAVADWFRRHFAHRQLLILISIMVFIAIVIWIAGDKLAPAIAAVIISYLLQGAINRLVAHSVPRRLAFWLVFAAAIALTALIAFGLLPLLFREVSKLLQQVPAMITSTRHALDELPSRYPDLITMDQINRFSSDMGSQVLKIGQSLLSYSFSSALTLITLLVYLILVPFMVFFMVKDKDLIIGWLLSFLPSDRSLTNQVWYEIDVWIDRYIQGKVWEIAIVGVVTYATFLFLGLQYSLLLAALTGFSVVIPYIGAAVITVPVAFVGYYQFGWSAELAYVVTAYLIIQALDGNILAPLLFGEVVNLHPVAIIIAVLFFGGFWGFWGVFFAIPLATVIHAVIAAWPDLSELPEPFDETNLDGPASYPTDFPSAGQHKQDESA